MMPRRAPNSYSHHWFKFFHAGIDAARTTREVDFICACAPLPAFANTLDIGCGFGRHARALARLGYSVVGIDRDPVAIETARQLGGGPTYVHVDARDYRPIASSDLIIIMSQSFGYFDAPTNCDVLSRLASGLREGGRIILDLWNPHFFVAHQGTRSLQFADGVVQERKHVDDGRLFVHLEYPDDATDDFEWELYDVERMNVLAGSSGLVLGASCSGFDLARKMDASDPRIQFILERPPR
jgi:SAM-dependent methyltransferase